MTKDQPLVTNQLPDRPRRRVVRRILTVTFSLFMGCLLIGGGTLAWLVYAVPLDLVTERTEPSPAVIVEAADGTLIGLRGELRGTPASREDLPDSLVKAVIAIEDRRFFDHGGIDFCGVARAAWRNFRANEVVEDGSRRPAGMRDARSRRLPNDFRHL